MTLLVLYLILLYDKFEETKNLRKILNKLIYNILKINLILIKIINNKIFYQIQIIFFPHIHTFFSKKEIKFLIEK
jgi:hypothetical protein